MASPLTLSPETNSDRSRESRRKKKRLANTSQNQNQNQMRWNSPSEQQSYSSKLIEALRQVRRNRNPSSSSEIPPNTTTTTTTAAASSSTPRGGRAVREAADRALAVAAKGRTRWSRAILTSRIIKLKLKKTRKQRVTAAAIAGDCRSKKRRGFSVLGLNLKDNKKKILPNRAQVQRRVRVLGRLVPGCRKLSLPNLLEEATDYVAALEMQVRAMTALAHLLSSVSPAGSSPVDRLNPSRPPTQS